MGNGIVVGHLGTDHDGFPPTPVTAGSATVRYDGIPAARLGDPLALTINQSILAWPSDCCGFWDGDD